MNCKNDIKNEGKISMNRFVGKAASYFRDSREHFFTA